MTCLAAGGMSLDDALPPWMWVKPDDGSMAMSMMMTMPTVLAQLLG
jgi:hypothetical protein